MKKSVGLQCKGCAAVLLTILAVACCGGCGKFSAAEMKDTSTDELGYQESAESSIKRDDVLDLLGVDEDELLNAYLAELAGIAGYAFLLDDSEPGETVFIEGFADIPEVNRYVKEDGSSTELLGEMNFFRMKDGEPEKQYGSWHILHWKEWYPNDSALYDRIYFPYMKESERRDSERDENYQEWHQSDEVEVSLRAVFQRCEANDDTAAEAIENRISETAWKDLLVHLMLKNPADVGESEGSWSGEIYLADMSPDGTDKKEKYVDFWVCRDGENPRKLHGTYQWLSQGMTRTYLYEETDDEQEFTDEMKTEALVGYKVKLEYAFPEKKN